MSTPTTIYEDYLVPILFTPLIDPMFKVARPRQGERVLDIGCGSGIVARHAASHVEPNGTVIGLDPSPAMLAVADDRANEQGLSIEWIQGTAEDIPIPANSIDLIFCSQAIQFCPDQRAAMREMRRVLTDGGRAVVSVWTGGLESFPVYAALDAAIEKHIGAAPLRAAYSADIAQLRDWFTEAGFGQVEIESVEFTARYPQVERYVELQITASTAAIPVMRGLSGEDLAGLIGAIEDEMQPTITAFTEGTEMIIPAYADIIQAVP